MIGYVKKNAAIVLFGAGKFSNVLINSNHRNFRYDWIWLKNMGGNILNSHKMPIPRHENIHVFYRKLPLYNPQHFYSKPYTRKGVHSRSSLYGHIEAGEFFRASENGERLPTSILTFDCIHTNHRQHPTQKPVPLLEYLIKTYTNEGETVLDSTCGSGSTLVAAVNTGRRFIGFELEPKYYDIACERVAEAQRSILYTVGT
jgi:site-specific DNA-methyltransferase (adenine-specific)